MPSRTLDQQAKDRWHCAIRIQSAIRGALCRLRFAPRLLASRKHIDSHIAGSLANEACLLIQTQFRRHLAMLAVAEKRRAVEAANAEVAVMREAVPELFSAYDIPTEMLDFDGLLRGRTETSKAANRRNDDCSMFGLIEATGGTGRPYDDLSRSDLLTVRLHAIFDFIDRHLHGWIDQRYCCELAEIIGGPAADGGREECLKLLRRIKGGVGGHKAPPVHEHMQVSRAEFFSFMTTLLRR